MSEETPVKKKAAPAKKATKKAVKPPAKPRQKKYVNNGDLLKEIEKSRKQGKMTDELAKMLMELCTRYSTHPDYANIYSYKQDMVSFALMTLCKVWVRFDPAKSNNPFAYFTQIARHAFYQYLNSEKKQRTVKDEVLIEMGELPSFLYMEEHANNNSDDADFHEQYDSTVHDVKVSKKNQEESEFANIEKELDNTPEEDDDSASDIEDDDDK